MNNSPDFSTFKGSSFFPHVLKEDEIITEKNIDKLPELYKQGISVFENHETFVKWLKSEIKEVIDDNSIIDRHDIDELKTLNKDGYIKIIDILNYQDEELRGYYRTQLYNILGRRKRP